MIRSIPININVADSRLKKDLKQAEHNFSIIYVVQNSYQCGISVILNRNCLKMKEFHQ